MHSLWRDNGRKPLPARQRFTGTTPGRPSVSQTPGESRSRWFSSLQRLIPTYSSRSSLMALCYATFRDYYIQQH